ncbi:MAG: hypothetical protein ACRC6A_06975 [Fusobacteriaceae bacterium]
MIIKNSGNFNNNGVIGNNNTFINYGNVGSQIQAKIDDHINDIIANLNEDSITPDEIKNLIKDSVNDIKEEKDPSKLNTIFKTLRALGSIAKWLPEKLEALNEFIGV